LGIKFAFLIFGVSIAASEGNVLGHTTVQKSKEQGGPILHSHFFTRCSHEHHDGQFDANDINVVHYDKDTLREDGFYVLHEAKLRMIAAQPSTSRRVVSASRGSYQTSSIVVKWDDGFTREPQLGHKTFASISLTHRNASCLSCSSSKGTSTRLSQDLYPYWLRCHLVHHPCSCRSQAHPRFSVPTSNFAVALA
jgi:hypothetical protein